MMPFTPPPDPVMRRACTECDAIYTGRLRCPACDFGMGEPLDRDHYEQDEPHTQR